MERIVRVFTSFAAADDADLEEWLELTPEERVRIGEDLREEAFPKHEPGLQRVLRLVERGRS